MTVVKPNENNGVWKLILAFGALIIITASFYVYLYSNLVSLRHDALGLRSDIEKLRVENAELKNQYYASIDSRELEKLAEEQNLIYDKNPQWAFASQF